MDPAAEKIPYEPDVDVRDYVTVKELMARKDLGPNGAIIEAVDEVTLYIEDIKDKIYEAKPGYIIFDTPGQMELFVFRASGLEVISRLSGDRCAVVFLFDSLLSLSPSSFISLLLLAASTHYRLSKPQIIALNKVDLIREEDIERIKEWIGDPEALLRDLREESGYEKVIHESIIRALSDYLSVFDLIPVSSTEGKGLERVYSLLQEIYVGGEDYTSLPP